LEVETMRKLTVFLAVVLAVAALWTGCEQPAGPVASPPERTAKPEADPQPGRVGAGTAIRLSVATEGAEIYYTIDGTEPDTTKTKYLAPIRIDAARTIRALAVSEGQEDSEALTAAYTMDRSIAAVPWADPPAGAVAEGTMAALATTGGAEIYYTTDGTAPDRTKTKYAGPIPINAALTIRALAVKEELSDSAAMEAAYTIGSPAKPVAVPAAGEVNFGAEVTLSTATEGAEIYYTIDGSEPTSAGPKYDNSPISITTALTIRAVAVKGGLEPSETLEAAYTVVASGTAAMPRANPPAGETDAGTGVTLSTTTEGAEIYYTTDGTAPDRTKAKYTGPITVSAALTIKAIAVKEGMADSAVLEAAYTIKGPPAPPPERAETPTADPPAGEVSAGTTVTLSTATPGAEIYYTVDGTAPGRTRTKYTGPVPINTTLTIRAIAFKAGLTDSGTLTAFYSVAAANRAAQPSANPAAGAVPAGTAVALSTTTPGAEIYYTVDGTAPDRTGTKYTGPVPINTALTIRAIAVKEGMNDSGVLEAAYAIQAPPRAETPEADPPAGEVTAGTAVTLYTGTPGAEIYYTTDGSEPDSTKTKYTERIGITAALTIKAVAVKDGMTDSSTLTASYTVAAPGRVAQPSAYPPDGEVSIGTAVTLSTTTPGAEIYYTVDGSVADRTRTKYNGPIILDEITLMIRAIAVKDGMEDSGELTAAYSIAMPEEPGPEPVEAEGIEVASKPATTLYGRNQTFEGWQGLSVVRVYSDGSREPLKTGEYTLSPSTPDTSRDGPLAIRVRSGGFETEFQIYVSYSSSVLLGISVQTPSRAECLLGHPFDLSGVVVEGTYSDGARTVPNSAVSVEGYDRYKREAQTVTLRVNNRTTTLLAGVRVPPGSVIIVNVYGGGGGNHQERDMKSVYIRGKEFDFAKSNIQATVSTAAGARVILKPGNGLYPEDVKNYDKNRAGLQTIALDLDGIEKKFEVGVIDVAPDVWFDYGYMRHEGDPGGVGAGFGKHYARPGETLVLAPVRYLIGWNDDHSPAAGTTYSWSVSGGAYDTSAATNGEFFDFTPSATGTYTVRVSVTGKSYVTGDFITKTAETEAICYTGTVSETKTWWKSGSSRVVKNFAPGQFVQSGAGYGWSLGTIGGYMMWQAPQGLERYGVAGNDFGAWAEPGIVWMMEDNNGNGVPDEMWYEIKGPNDILEEYLPFITRRYAITFVNAGEETVNEYGQTLSAPGWVDCRGRTDTLPGGWPKDWGVTGDWVTYTCTILGDDGNIANGVYGGDGHFSAIPTWYREKNRYLGYVDARTHSSFYVDDAIDARGNPVTLTNVRFIKVHTARFSYGGIFGEVSTEVSWGEGMGNSH
jgi:transcription elongation GreA/GreB family factor